MADYEVRDADIWVGTTPPTAAEPDDFWFDTSKVPLFGVTIQGTLDTVGPPTVEGAGGEAWWDTDGDLWVSDGDGNWVNQGNFRGPAGPEGPTGPAGPPFTVNGTLGSAAELPTDPSAGDAYVIVPDLFIWDGDTWVTVPFTGPTGPAGPSGAGFTIMGTLPDEAPPTAAGASAGDSWIVPDGGGMWVWDGDKWTLFGGGDPALTEQVQQLQALVANLQERIELLEAAELHPRLVEWLATADWSSGTAR